MTENATVTPDGLSGEIHEYVRDIFNRAVTYYTFHIGLNYLVLGWIATQATPLSVRAVWFLAIIFILHNLFAVVSYAAVAKWLKPALPPGTPPYLLATQMMLLTLVKMVIVWFVTPFVLSRSS